jgi:hypothetical protein
MGGQPARTRQGRSLRQVVGRHGEPVPGVFQAQQAAACKVLVIGLDGGGDIGQRHLATGIQVQGLWLYAAQHRRATAFIAVGVGQLAHDVFVAPPAVRQQRTQIGLRARGHEQGCFKAQQRGNFFLQCQGAGVVTKHVVAQRRAEHGVPHGGRGLGHGVAAQVDYSGSSQKLIGHIGLQPS